MPKPYQITADISVHTTLVFPYRKQQNQRTCVVVPVRVPLGQADISNTEIMVIDADDKFLNELIRATNIDEEIHKKWKRFATKMGDLLESLT